MSILLLISNILYIIYIYNLTVTIIQIQSLNLTGYKVGNRTQLSVSSFWHGCGLENQSSSSHKAGKPCKVDKISILKYPVWKKKSLHLINKYVKFLLTLEML